MANYFYVKVGGTATTATATATTDPTTQRTGAWSGTAADHFASVTLAILGDDTLAPVAGDYIMCSSTHALSQTTKITWALPDGVTIISVDNSNQEQYLAGAKETVDNTTTTLDFDIQNAAVSQYNAVIGMTIEAENLIGIEGTGCVWQVKDCTFNWLNAHAAQELSFTNLSNGTASLYDCELNYGHIGSVSVGSIQIGTGCDVNFSGITSTGTAVTTLIEFAAEGGHVTMQDCNLAQLIASSGNLIDDFITADRFLSLKVDACKLPTSMNVFRVTPAESNHFVDIAASGSADEYYAFFQQHSFNTAEEDLTQYLVGGVTYDGSTGSSTKITTGADVTPGFIYRYKVAQTADVDLSTDQTVTIELVSSDAGLTDTEVWIEIEYQDGTDQALGQLVSSRNTDYLAAGTTLTTAGVGVWNVTSNTEYLISQAIGAQTGATNSNITVYVCMAIASTVINVDPSAAIAAT